MYVFVIFYVLAAIGAGAQNLCAVRARQLLHAEQPVRVQPNGSGMRVLLSGKVIGFIKKSCAELEAEFRAEASSPALTVPSSPVTRPDQPQYPVLSSTHTPAPTVSSSPTPSASSSVVRPQDPRPVQEPLTRADGPTHPVITASSFGVLSERVAFGVGKNYSNYSIITLILNLSCI